MKKLSNFDWIIIIILFGVSVLIDDARSSLKKLKVKKITLLFIFLAFFLLSSFALTGQTRGQVSPYPVKSTAYWTKPTLSLSEAQSLARHDFLIVDLENKFNNYQVLQALKEMNPKLKLLAYSNPMEIHLIKYGDRPWQNRIIDEIVTTRTAWLLKTIAPINYEGFIATWVAKIMGDPDRKEDYAKFWSGMLMLNMSATCPRIDGQNYEEWMAQKLNREVLNDPIWDGYFQDNGTGNISWTHPGQIDIDGNQEADNDALVDKNWKEGMTNFILQIKKAKPAQFIIITNKGSLDFLNITSGKWFENFPNDYLGEKWANGWRQCFENAKKMGPYTVFQGNRSNVNFVLATTLLLDNVYLAISQDDSGIFPELEIETGRPLGRYENKNGIYYREYEKVSVMVDPLKQVGKITKK
ncbi:MAG: hypothetical protein HY931_01195 [Candidatus Falkowbacteria bacterium]|nr:MAG: hypothetical protein HY931_01195 [Candidatus Falkowbacteria bacterium]